MQFRVHRTLLAMQVRALRRNYRIPTTAVATYMGISASRLSRIESNPHLIKVPQFYLLMEAIGADIEPCGQLAQLTHQLVGWRKKLGLTQTRFGALLGVSQSRIAHIEQDAAHLSVEMLLKLLEALRISLYIGQQIHRQPLAPALAMAAAASEKTNPPTQQGARGARRQRVDGVHELHLQDAAGRELG